MADFLTINGRVYDVLEGGAQEPAGDMIGEERRAIDGSLRSSVQTSKRAYRFTLEPLDPADANYAALDAVSLSGDFVPCGGSAIVASTYRVKIENCGFVVHELAFLRAPDVSLREV